MIKTFISKTSMTLILEYAVCLQGSIPQYEVAMALVYARRMGPR
ncbi:Unknown protein sequence [Pseudomonas syringae pv. cilantro]|uniref:Uncharacterized protein n=1 Tax=Pseudomonas syringae pv. cilantro TaxID=81035 RepID=A0A0N0GHN0_PSESX|nr:Unknown protein sequence [Pseudomonas syringae pv. cilantro]